MTRTTTIAALPTLPGQGSPHGPAKQQAHATNLTPPAQYDRMRAPVWTHNPAPAARAGADGHKSIGSRGVRC